MAALWDVWCGLECHVGCGIVICNLYLNAMFMAWCEVECGVLVYGMLHNARCEKLRCDVKCGGVEL